MKMKKNEPKEDLISTPGIRSDMQKSLVQRVPSIFFVICVDFVYSVALPIYLLELPKSVQLPT